MQKMLSNRFWQNAVRQHCMIQSAQHRAAEEEILRGRHHPVGWMRKNWDPNLADNVPPDLNHFGNLSKILW